MRNKGSSLRGMSDILSSYESESWFKDNLKCINTLDNGVLPSAEVYLDGQLMVCGYVKLVCKILVHT